jgi:hypothetical protein
MLNFDEIGQVEQYVPSIRLKSIEVREHNFGIPYSTESSILKLHKILSLPVYGILKRESAWPRQSAGCRNEIFKTAALKKLNDILE